MLGQLMYNQYGIKNLIPMNNNAYCKPINNSSVLHTIFSNDLQLICHHFINTQIVCDCIYVNLS